MNCTKNHLLRVIRFCLLPNNFAAGSGLLNHIRPNVDMLAFVSGTGVLLGALTSLFLLTVKRPERTTALRFLGLYTLSLTVGLAEPLIPAGALLLRYAAGGISLLYGPFLYLYCQYRLNADRRASSSWKHFLPFLGYYLMLTTERAFAVASKEVREGVELALYILLFVQITGYCFLADLFVRHHQEQVDGSSVFVRSSRLFFLKMIVRASGGFFLLTFVLNFCLAIFGFADQPAVAVSIQVGVCIIIFLIALLNTETMHAEKLVE